MSGGGSWRWWAGKALRGGLWAGLVVMCAAALKDVVGTRIVGERLECQEAVRRSRWAVELGAPRQVQPLSDEVVEGACREQYFARRDPDDGVALGRALLARRELRGAAAVGQGLLLTRVRAEALVLLANVAVRERRFEEAAGSYRLAAELYERQERRGEAAATWLSQAEVWRAMGREVERRAAMEEAARLSGRPAAAPGGGVRPGAAPAQR